MRTLPRALFPSLAFPLVVMLACAVPRATAGPAQQAGALEFVTRVSPSGGRPEPVRQLAFFLLRKSFADIQKEAEETEPKADFGKFVDGLEVSKELKAWMKKHHTAALAGTEFLRKLSVDDVMDVPEFYAAYLKRNSGYSQMGFPAQKYKSQDAAQNPERYQRQVEDYRKQVRRYIEGNPESVDGIDAHLDTINPGRRWVQQESEARQRAHRRALQLAQTRYLAARAETDLDGRAMLTGIPAGNYWLSTLEIEAVVGDAHLRWDLPVTVRAGATERVELSNLNALEPQRPPR